MKLLDFINTTYDWEDILSKPPYCIEIKKDGEYILLKYNQLESDFNLFIVQECRGCIIKPNEVVLDILQPTQYHYVCRPFDKFFNYGEQQAAKIDWNTAFVSSKIDGSILKLWWDREWKLSTNGTINAFNAPTRTDNISFGDVFYKAVDIKDINEWCKELDKAYTYMFELTSPETRVVIDYDYGVYFLAKRHTFSGRYADNIEEVYNLKNIQFPEIYTLKDLQSCLSLVEKMSFDEEGIVVADKQGNRIKIKSREYLLRAKLYGQGQKSDDYLLEIIFNGTEDDLLAYCPEYKERTDELKLGIINYEKECNSLWDKYSNLLPDRKSFALAVKEYIVADYLFYKADKKEMAVKPFEYLKNKTISKAINVIYYLLQ